MRREYNARPKATEVADFPALFLDFKVCSILLSFFLLLSIAARVYSLPRYAYRRHTLDRIAVEARMPPHTLSGRWENYRRRLSGLGVIEVHPHQDTVKRQERGINDTPCNAVQQLLCRE